jgi:hypothetical protein
MSVKPQSSPGPRREDASAAEELRRRAERASEQANEREGEADEQRIGAREAAGAAGVEDPSDEDERSAEEQRERLRHTPQAGYDESGD